jgi:hypothetical protein
VLFGGDSLLEMLCWLEVEKMRAKKTCATRRERISGGLDDDQAFEEEDVDDANFEDEREPRTDRNELAYTIGSRIRTITPIHP